MIQYILTITQDICFFTSCSTFVISLERFKK